MSTQLEKKTRRPAPMIPDPQKIRYAEKCSWFGVPVAEMDREELLMMVYCPMTDLEFRRIEEMKRREMPIGQYL